MLAVVQTAAICGLESVAIEVEVDVAKQSFPGFTVVGLPGKSVDEAKERVRSAIRNSGAEFPQYRITVNLAPADIPKNGPGFDLAMALGLLEASEQLKPQRRGGWYFGELSLDGSVRPIRGCLALCHQAKQQGAAFVYVPQENAAEAASIDGLIAYGVETLAQAMQHLGGAIELYPSQAPGWAEQEHDIAHDMADILGQEQAKRALEIAAAGGHNVLMEGLPGSGKTMLAKAFAGILPPLTVEEAMEISAIHSICGLLGDKPVIERRPFRSPHHTVSRIGLIGGGGQPKPGEVSLAHKGVLFLDELPEFSIEALECLRQPLEDRVVTVSRAKASYIFPAGFQLVAAQNPCPCGHWGDPVQSCGCSAAQISRYQKRISGPLLDRIDLFLQVPRVDDRHLTELGKSKAESSALIRDRVRAAKERQIARFSQKLSQAHPCSCNADMSLVEVKEYCQLDSSGNQLLRSASQRLQLSARGYFKVVKVARTIADLAGSRLIEAGHLAEAIQYRRSVTR